MNRENLKLALMALISFAAAVAVIVIVHQATTTAVVHVVEK
jgi:hypothetical protein